ncbi:MAG: hypothetical protein WAT71_01250 [Ignavibacteria bacterium]
MNTQINKIINAIIFFTFVITLLINSESINAQSYFGDYAEVPVYEDTIIANTTNKFDFWDLGQVNTDNNRLDMVVGVSQKGITSGAGNSIIGNW